MKTQIIMLSAHDDLAMVRDKMSWITSSRILLVWPTYEHVPLRFVDLRILEQHARKRGARLGVVARSIHIRREASWYGIPVFPSTEEAQRNLWKDRPATGWRPILRTGERIAWLRATRQRMHQAGTRRPSQATASVWSLLVAVAAVSSLVSLFIPRASLFLTPTTFRQQTKLRVDVESPGGPGIVTGAVTAQDLTLNTGGSLTVPVTTRSEIPREKASGAVRFLNLTAAPVDVPSGTIVYSLAPTNVRFRTLHDVRLEGRVNAAVDAPIEAIDAGQAGNVPAGAIQGIEGGIAGSSTVTNPAPTQGGLDVVEHVASDADRNRLRARLMIKLQADAESEVRALLDEDDAILPGTLEIVAADQETFDPRAGQPGKVLSLKMHVTYRARYVKGAELLRLAEIALDAELPSGFTARPGTLAIESMSVASTAEQGTAQLQLKVGRTVASRIDASAANQLVRGMLASRAQSQLQSWAPLAAPPEIQLLPSWWPWLPLLPFRIKIVVM